MIFDMVLHNSTSFRMLEEIANQCSAFQSDIAIMKGEHVADAKDIIDLVTLSLHPEDRLKFIVKGSDSEEATQFILRLLN